MYTILGTAADGRIYQFPRLLGLTAPIGELSSDTLIVAYNPETQSGWTVADIKNDPEWLAKGNPDENGETGGYTFEKLDPGQPLSENNFILTDVPGNRFEEVWKWLRSRVPANDGAGEGETWRYRDGVVMAINPPGTLPDSDPDPDGTYPVMNALNWLRVDIYQRRFDEFERWRHTYLVSDPEASPAQVAYVPDQYAENDKVGRTGDPTPFYEYPVGAPVLGLVDPLHLEAGLVKWTRLQR